MITTVHKINNITAQNVRLFTGKLSSSFTWYLTKNGGHHYAIDTLLYLRTSKEKNILRCIKNLLQSCTSMQRQ